MAVLVLILLSTIEAAIFLEVRSLTLIISVIQLSALSIVHSTIYNVCPHLDTCDSGFDTHKILMIGGSQ